MHNIGRNDPCPCDSGKKYKKCCLPKINANSQAHVLDSEQKLNLAIDGIPALDKESNKAEEDPVIKYNELLRELEEFIYSNDVDDESIFEFFESLYSLSCRLNKFDDFFNLALKLKERHPDIYQTEGKYILCSWIDAKLRLEQIGEACEAFIEFCHVCDHDLDIFYPAMNKLLYYGCHETILQGIDIIWPKVEASNLFDWAIEELKLKYCHLSCFAEFLNSNSPKTKSNIINKLSNFDMDENDLDYATKVFDILLSNKAIEPENILTSIKSLDSDDSLHNLIHEVINAFTCHIIKVKNINPGLAWCYWISISDYIIDRANGDLGINTIDLSHPFIPEEKTLDKYIMRNFSGMMGWHLEPHRVIIFLQAMIQWIEFLFENNLIDSPIIPLKDMSSLCVELYKAITPESDSKKIKSDAKELLITLRDLIKCHESGDHKNVCDVDQDT